MLSSRAPIRNMPWQRLHVTEKYTTYTNFRVHTFPIYTANANEFVQSCIGCSDASTWLCHYNDVLIGFWNHQPHDYLLNRLFRCWSKKTPKLRVTGLCAGNSPVAGEFPAQMASDAENVSIWWRHHDATSTLTSPPSWGTASSPHHTSAPGCPRNQLVSGIVKCATYLVLGLPRYTCPDHLSCRLRITVVISSIPSF